MKQATYIEGFTASVWKSLAVKSNRLGWPEGLRQASLRLSPSAMRSLLVTGVFEDTFPAVDELREAMDEIERLDFEALCSRETHHGRGHTQRFYDIREAACHAADNDPREQARMWAKGDELGIRLNPRALNVFWTWLHIHPTDSGKRRVLDNAPWRGMPAAVVDSHTYEGKVGKVGATILSGHYHKHRELSELVAAHGWDWVRAKVHDGPTVQPHETQLGLFDLTPTPQTKTKTKHR